MGCMSSSVSSAPPGPEITSNLFMAAIVASHSKVDGVPPKAHKFVTVFLKRARYLCPPCFYNSPELNLIFVQESFKTLPYEYMLNAKLKRVFLKTALPPW